MSFLTAAEYPAEILNISACLLKGLLRVLITTLRHLSDISTLE
jgi:hypothetical protein